MAYNDNYCNVFTNLGYTCAPYNGAYQFSGDAPSQTIIDAVESLPYNLVQLWNLDITTDAAALAVRDLVSAGAWANFSSWHNEQWLLACQTIINNGSGGIQRCMALYNSGGFSSCRDYDKDLLDSAGMTRHPF